MDREETGSFGVGGIEDFGGDVGSERSIITARGTGDGLIIRLDGRADAESLREAFIEFVNSRKRFLSGNNVALEWVSVMPGSDFIGELSQIAKDFDIEVKSSVLKEAGSSKESRWLKEGPGGSPLKDEIEVSRGAKRGTGGDSMGLFGGIEPYSFEDEQPRRSARAERVGSAGSIDGNVWDVADARTIFSTIRSGQKIETEHSILIFGDVNSGAELIAGGDIIVLGTLRGVAHAGAYDETGGGRVIFALNLQATQLRIGAVISRGASADGTRVPEIARVDGTTIVVEPYQTKGTLSRRRDM